MYQSIGLIEVSGLLPAITVADTMVKVANIKLVALEKANGYGWMTIKIKGDLDSVRAAIDAGEQKAVAINRYLAKKVIARPDDSVNRIFLQIEVEAMTHKKDDVIEKVTDSQRKEGAVLEKELDHQLKKTDVKDEKNYHEQSENNENNENSVVTCNLCQTSECPRRKREPKVNCLYYDN